MQTLVFNTRTKTVQLLDGRREGSNTIEYFENVPTVKIEQGYYEVMKKMDEESTTVIPVLRVPISNTNMVIIK
jgi:hypothetical protein